MRGKCEERSCFFSGIGWFAMATTFGLTTAAVTVSGRAAAWTTNGFSIFTHNLIIYRGASRVELPPLLSAT